MCSTKKERSKAWSCVVMPKIKNGKQTSQKKSYRKMMQTIMGATATDEEKKKAFQIQIQSREGGGSFSKLEEI